MVVSCAPEIFVQFEEGCGGDVTPDREGLKFLYEALGDGLEFSGLTKIEIPELDNEKFGDWTKFEYWCDEIDQGLMSGLIDDEKLEEIYETSTPKDYFIEKDIILEKVLTILQSKESLSVMYVVIESEGKTLCLVYGDEGEGWALGHYDSVFVARSLHDLTEELGYYPQL